MISGPDLKHGALSSGLWGCLLSWKGSGGMISGCHSYSHCCCLPHPQIDGPKGSPAAWITGLCTPDLAYGQVHTTGLTCETSNITWIHIKVNLLTKEGELSRKELVPM